MRKILLMTAAVAIITAAYAAPAMAGEDQFFGTGIGAALGGLLGSQIGHGSGRLVATGAGVFLGGVVGNDIGRSMDRADYAYNYPRYSTYYAPTPVYYSTGYYTPNYVAPPAPPPVMTVYDTPSSSYCREFSQQILIGNRVHESYGTACLQPDGSWRVVQ